MGPDDWKKRMSSLDCVTKQTCVTAGVPGLLQGASPAVGSSLADRYRHSCVVFCASSN